MENKNKNKSTCKNKCIIWEADKVYIRIHKPGIGYDNICDIKYCPTCGEKVFIKQNPVEEYLSLFDEEPLSIESSFLNEKLNAALKYLNEKVE